jgi:hypothetical protein
VAHIPGLLTYARTRVETSFFFSSQEWVLHTLVLAS